MLRGYATAAAGLSGRIITGRRLMVRVGAVFVWRYNAIVLHGHQTDAQGIGYGRLLGRKVFVLNSYPNSIMSVRIKNIADAI